MERKNGRVLYFLLAVMSCILISSSYADSSACGDPGLAALGWKQHSPTPQNGIYGGNRHIYSPKGIGYVSGTFHIPMDMYINLGPDNKNPYRNKPTLYLGAKGSGYEIDSGLVYEPVKINKLDPGWSVFTNTSVGSCGKWDQSTKPSNREIFNKGQTLTVVFSLKPTGILYLYLQDFPPTVVDIFPTSDKTASPTGMMIKRNIGITQGVFLKTDGSYMHGAGFSGGEVKKWVNNNGEWELGEKMPWPIAGSSKGSEGYIPDTKNEGLVWPPGNNLAGTPKYLVDSEGWWRRTYAKSEGSHTPSRFEEEYVDVDLLTAPAQVEPKDKKPGKS